MVANSNNNDFDLLNNFAHDLKTPLSAVKSYIELVEHSGELNDQQKHFADRAQRGLARVQQIIDELMDFARMENNLTLHFETVNLMETIIEAVHLMETMADEKGVKIYVDIPEALHNIHADPRMLRHVVSNLLSNAIKYNVRDGQIHINATDVRDFVQITVRDTGIGIPEDSLPRVFERFYRVERRQGGRKIEGTGLGLAIVKTVVERHGGNITVESILEKGTIFTFTMPRALTSSEEHEREASDDTQDHMQENREIIEDSDSRDDYLNGQ